MQLICGFVYAYAKSKFSHGAAHMMLDVFYWINSCHLIRNLRYTLFLKVQLLDLNINLRCLL